jgi:hypothetical protein
MRRFPAHARHQAGGIAEFGEQVAAGLVLDEIAVTHEPLGHEALVLVGELKR